MNVYSNDDVMHTKYRDQLRPHTNQLYLMDLFLYGQNGYLNHVMLVLSYKFREFFKNFTVFGIKV